MAGAKSPLGGPTGAGRFTGMPQRGESSQALLSEAANGRSGVSFRPLFCPIDIPYSTLFLLVRLFRLEAIYVSLRQTILTSRDETRAEGASYPLQRGRGVVQLSLSFVSGSNPSSSHLVFPNTVLCALSLSPSYHPSPGTFLPLSDPPRPFFNRLHVDPSTPVGS